LSKQKYSPTSSNGRALSGELSDRRTERGRPIEKLRTELNEAEERARGKACIYVTGSFGRCEASQHSDLDLFIVGKADDKGKRLLKRLDEICIKADLIDVTRRLNIPEFSGDGRYLEHYTVQELTQTLGKEEEDSQPISVNRNGQCGIRSSKSGGSPRQVQ
jgi:predicted nucleotidyltransferase